MFEERTVIDLIVVDVQSMAYREDCVDLQEDNEGGMQVMCVGLVIA